MKSRIELLFAPRSIRTSMSPRPPRASIAARSPAAVRKIETLRPRRVTLGPVGPKTSKSLLLQLQDPDNATGWNRFWGMYEDLLRTYMRRLRVREQDFDDLINDLFIKLKSLLPKFRLDQAKGSFRGWLRRVTDNHILDFYRGQQRQARRLHDAAEYMAALQKTLDDTPAAEREREQAWQRNLDALVLERARTDFAKRATTWACFERVMLKGEQPKAVAAALGVNKVNTVYVYCKRVMDHIETLRTAFDEAHEYDPETANIPAENPESDGEVGDGRQNLPE